jgi:hypothetical protein
MKYPINKFTNFGLLVAALLISPQLVTAENQCAAVMKHNFVQGLLALNPGVSESTLSKELCSNSLGSQKTTNILNGTVQVSKAELAAGKDLLCSRKGGSKKILANQRVLKDLLGADSLKEYKKCLRAEKSGVVVETSGYDQTKGSLTIAASALKPGLTVQGFESIPAGAFSCEVMPASEDNSNALGGAALVGNCIRANAASLEPAIISVRTSVGQVNLNFAAQSPAAGLDLANAGRVEFPSLPNIPGCVVRNAASRIMTCSERNAWQLCNAELAAGNVLDCRVQFRSTALPNVREVQIRPAAGEYEYAQSGSLNVTVYRNRPHAGVARGRINYRMNVETPARPASSPNRCDPSNPLLGDMGCNRDCVFADHILETPSAFGIRFFGNIEGGRRAGCSGALAYEVDMSLIDTYRAYNLCEANDAWGHYTTGYLYVRVSKYFFFNDFVTSHTVTRQRHNGRWNSVETYGVSNHGERVRTIVDLELPIRIGCAV